MRGLLPTIHNVTHNMRVAISGHFSNHIGGSLSGFYARIPFTRLSMWLEWREQPVGFGGQRGDGRAWEFFCGRAQGVLCIEPAAGR